MARGVIDADRVVASPIICIAGHLMRCQCRQIPKNLILKSRYRSGRGILDLSGRDSSGICPLNSTARARTTRLEPGGESPPQNVRNLQYWR